MTGMVDARWGRRFFKKLFNKEEGDSQTTMTCKHTGPTILKNGAAVQLDSFPSIRERGLNVSIVDEKKKLYYVHNFLTAQEADEMRGFCSEPGRFQRSPQTGVEVGGSESQARTSSSCPLLFAIFYIPRFAEVNAKNPALARELELTWNVTVRAAELLGVDPANLEPFQLLKCNCFHLL